MPSKFPLEYRKYRTSFFQVSFRGQKSFRIRHCDDLYFQVAPTLNNSIYICVCVCVYDRASILFLPRVKLAQFSLTSNAWPWLSFEQLFKSVCLTLRLPCFFFFLSSIFNPIFLFLSLESRDEVILREPTRKLPNFRSFSFIFSLEITRPTMFMRSYKSSRSLVISNPFASILSGFRFNKIFPRKRIGKKAQLSFFYFIHPICIIYDV